ncbi:hypothetical protein MXD61_17375 [Frankia sp. AgPm24]|uniref:hypothetical protein n=1 Tax=Frankia sp. AgPm24 TaxID=631128 RepID=UPI00200E8A1A|nr:hypothetical protein [Frankia sp. AgPm24]MCK9923618.1 hypothetical protein [Frankia sp. AgPm24]
MAGRSSRRARGERRSRRNLTGLVTIPRAELGSLRAKMRRVRLELGRAVTRARIEADAGPGDGAPIFSRDELADAWKR